MTLTDEDLSLLKREGCLADVEAAARVRHAAYDDWLCDHDHSEGGETWAGLWPPSREAATAAMDAALRSQRLTPGQPSLDLLVAAIERRGWGYLMGDGAAGKRHQWWAKVYADAPFGGGLAATGADALALAFCAVLRATEGLAMASLADAVRSTVADLEANFQGYPFAREAALEQHLPSVRAVLRALRPAVDPLMAACGRCGGGGLVVDGPVDYGLTGSASRACPACGPIRVLMAEADNGS